MSDAWRGEVDGDRLENTDGFPSFICEGIGALGVGRYKAAKLSKVELKLAAALYAYVSLQLGESRWPAFKAPEYPDTRRVAQCLKEFSP